MTNQIDQIENTLKGISLARELINIGVDNWREVLESTEDDFEVDNFRFINTDEIDKIMQDELESDLYCLGACTPWFISEITGLDTNVIEKAQKDESFELLGALLAEKITEVQEKMVRYDGYGHHFNHYDGNEHEIGDYLVFRTN